MPRFSGQIENVESRRVPDEGVIGSDGGSARSARDHLRPRPDRRERGFETALAVNATHVVHRESLGTMGGADPTHRARRCSSAPGPARAIADVRLAAVRLVERLQEGGDVRFTAALSAT